MGKGSLQTGLSAAAFFSQFSAKPATLPGAIFPPRLLPTRPRLFTHHFRGSTCSLSPTVLLLPLVGILDGGLLYRAGNPVDSSTGGLDASLSTSDRREQGRRDWAWMGF